MAQLRAVRLREIDVQDAFWASRMKTNRETTLPREYELLEETGRLASFEPGVKTVHPYWDSDCAKWVEAAVYSLAKYPDPELEARVDRYIDSLVKAQTADGYLNSYYQKKEPDKRWTNLRDMHELYTAGHLMEAAVAYYEQCGKRALLDVMCRNADHIAQVFGSRAGQKRGYAGHPEIELALMRLYRATKQKRYLDLAAFFIDERGRAPHYYDEEARARGEGVPEKVKTSPGHTRETDYAYYQAHMPLREQEQATGHSVRACYLYAGMADVAAETGDTELMNACLRIWRNLIHKRMYVTGGVGSTRHGEQFTVDYDLPNEQAYAETCAAISLVFFAQRLLNHDLNREYADVMERALYNGVLSGIDLDGTRFFYANRLAVYPDLLNSCLGHGSHSFAASRQAWFGTACCPPNIARLLADFGQYVASAGDDSLAVHLYAGSTLAVEMSGRTLALTMTTDYPWDGRVRIEITQAPASTCDLALRLPGWCRTPSLTVNGEAVDLAAVTKKGYAHLHRSWAAGDGIELDLPMPVERITTHPAVRHNAGCVALQRGPVVYCLEECDNGKDLGALALPRSAALEAKYEENLLGGCVVITGSGTRLTDDDWGNALYRFAPSATESVPLRAVPYCLWNNRGEGEMRVWIRESTHGKPVLF